jgi:hypothetical protein
MAHFFGALQGARGPATRLGSKGSGLTTTAASWNGAIQVEVRHNDGVDEFRVIEKPWHGRGIFRVVTDWQPFGGYATATAARNHAAA